MFRPLLGLKLYPENIYQLTSHFTRTKHEYCLHFHGGRDINTHPTLSPPGRRKQDGSS